MSSWALYYNRPGIPQNPAPEIEPKRKESYSILIGVEDGIYYAIDTVKGRTLIEDTDASNVINYAINALPNGGEIMIKKGIYLISKTIDLSLKKGIVIRGESYTWGHQKTDNGTILRLVSNVDMFKIDNSSLGEPQNNPAGIVFENLQLDGNVRSGLTSGNGIHAKWVGSLIVRNCHIHSFPDDGIHIEYGMDIRIINNAFGGASTSNDHSSTALSNGTWIPNNNGIYIDGGYAITIANNGIWHNKANGIYITNNTSFIENIYITNNYIVWNDNNGIYINRQTSNILWLIHIYNNTIDENYYNGIYAVNTYGGDWPLSLFIEGNQIVSNNRGNAGTYYGINIDGTTGSADAAEIVGNMITNLTSQYQQPIRLNAVNGARLVSNNLDSNPTITNSQYVLIDNITNPIPFGGLPIYTSLPTPPADGSVILYYDGTSWYIAAYVGGAWKKVALS